MSKTTKCYTFTSVLKMLDIHKPNQLNEVQDFLKLLDEHEVIIFQPRKSPGSSRARRMILTYLKSNKWLDQYIKEQNTWAVLKGRTSVKPQYKRYEPELIDNELFE